MTTAQPDGYFAAPNSGTGPAVLVLHAWWGLNGTIRAFCDRLAAEGFVVFAPDLYHGEIATTIPDAERLGGALDAKHAEAKAEIAQAAQFLINKAGQGATLAVIGFSLGAYYALHFSTVAPKLVRDVVIFYGTGGMDFSASKATYLGHFAENDPFEPKENVAELEGTLKHFGRPVTFYTYPRVGHWFFEPDRTDAYNKAAADLAWERTLAFLRR